jgi:hypothetical protein
LPKLSIKKRADGRYLCRYKGVCFYGQTQSEALSKRDAYRRDLEDGLRDAALGVTVTAYAARWIDI